MSVKEPRGRMRITSSRENSNLYKPSGFTFTFPIYQTSTCVCVCVGDFAYVYIFIYKARNNSSHALQSGVVEKSSVGMLQPLLLYYERIFFPLFHQDKFETMCYVGKPLSRLNLKFSRRREVRQEEKKRERYGETKLHAFSSIDVFPFVPSIDFAEFLASGIKRISEESIFIHAFRPIYLCLNLMYNRRQQAMKKKYKNLPAWAIEMHVKKKKKP